MIKCLFFTLAVFIHTGIHAQDDYSVFFYKAFPIYKSGSKTVIAGNVNSFLYSDYYGKNIKNERYTDVHSRPEYLVYEQFNAMKIKNITALGKLYDSSFDKSYFDGDAMASMMRRYDDVKFQSKFRCGSLIVIRYDFVSAGNVYPYFAFVKMIGKKYYLSLNFEIANPMNMVGTFSPYNKLKKAAEKVDTSSMTPFYFINKENKIFFTNQLPEVDYVAVYIAFDFYKKNGNSPEGDFIIGLQKAARAGDSATYKKMIAANDLPLLNDPLYLEYFKNLFRVFANNQFISPAALVNAGDKILYFKYADSVQNPHMAMIVLKESDGKPYLSFTITDSVVKQVLQNVYVQDAIEEYLKKIDN